MGHIAPPAGFSRKRPMAWVYVAGPMSWALRAHVVGRWHDQSSPGRPVAHEARSCPNCDRSSLDRLKDLPLKLSRHPGARLR